MKKQNKKKIIITVTAVVLVVAIGLGVWFGREPGQIGAGEGVCL